jgi:catechol 2,3-dioxygenase
VSAVDELIAAAPEQPAYDIVRAAWAELVVLDLDAAERFYVDLLGMIVSERSADALYLRCWEERPHHSLVLRLGPIAGVARLGFRVRTDGDLDLIAADFARRGCETSVVDGAAESMGRVVHVRDPYGFPLAFFHEMGQFDTQLQRFDLQHGAPLARIDHFNLHVTDVEATFAYWRTLGFRCTEYISTDGPDERITGAWLTRKPTVHDVALTAGRGPRLHHLGFAVPDTAGVMRACDQIAAAGHASAIERGPGRHGVSNAFFVYLRDPSGHRIELYACDYYTGDPDHRPLRWSAADASCRSFWGARAPDRWYLESSVVLGPDGTPSELSDADVDERDSFRSQVATLS